MPFKKNTGQVLIVGALVGIAAVILVKLGNPGNMGLCIVCFFRDTAGALGLHRARMVQYIRPEIIGITGGALAAALSKREFQVKGGSAPLARFVLGMFVVIGALVFLGCPLRMILRLAGGDLNALVGLVGFAAGIYIGTLFLNKGFTLKRTYSLQKSEGYVFPAVQLLFLVLLLAKPTYIFFSGEGPGSMRAPVLAALALGLLVGFGAQRSRLCLAGGIRDMIMFKDPHLLYGFLGVLAAALISGLVLGGFSLGFVGQPVAHTDGLWNLFGMLLTGFGAVLLGGCPLRQIILSAEGNIDSALTIMGMYIGAAFSHNFGLASSDAGVPGSGKIAVVVGLLAVFAIGFSNIDRTINVTMKGDVKRGSYTG